MKNMKKVLIIGGLVVSVSATGLFAGIKIGASTSWTNEAITNANAEIAQAGFDKKEELIGGNGISQAMLSALDPKIEEEKRELERLLEEYYQLKIAGLTDTVEFRNVESRIEEIRQSTFNRFKADIDKAFSAQ